MCQRCQYLYGFHDILCPVPLGPSLLQQILIAHTKRTFHLTPDIAVAGGEEQSKFGKLASMLTVCLKISIPLTVSRWPIAYRPLSLSSHVLLLFFNKLFSISHHWVICWCMLSRVVGSVPSTWANQAALQVPTGGCCSGRLSQSETVSSFLRRMSWLRALLLTKDDVHLFHRWQASVRRCWNSNACSQLFSGILEGSVRSFAGLCFSLLAWYVQTQSNASMSLVESGIIIRSRTPFQQMSTLLLLCSSSISLWLWLLLRLIIQRTKMIDESQEVLLKLLEDMTSGEDPARLSFAGLFTLVL